MEPYLYIIIPVLILCLFLYGWYIEPKLFKLRRIDVNVPWKLNPPLNVLQISDLHFHKGRTDSISFIQSLSELDVDFVLVTGDLIDEEHGIPLCIEALRPLKAKYGKFAVLGNHDYYQTTIEDITNKTGSLPKRHEEKQNDFERLIRELDAIGIRVLRNENLKFDIDGVPLTLVGIDDPYVHRDDIEKSFQGLSKEDACLTIVHSPEKHTRIANDGIANLVLCGHTHGGQIQIPLIGPILTRTNAPRRFVEGLKKEKDTWFFISNGIGSGPFTRPRFHCFPEAVLITIKNDSS